MYPLRGHLLYIEKRQIIATFFSEGSSVCYRYKQAGSQSKRLSLPRVLSACFVPSPSRPLQRHVATAFRTAGSSRYHHSLWKWIAIYNS